MSTVTPARHDRARGPHQADVREVAQEPNQDFHFDTGRSLAERLGHPPAALDRVPAAAIESFAGVGFFLDLAAIAAGETVLDLDSGSGTDSFLAALATGVTAA